MSSAARLARWNSRSRNWAGQDRVLGQRQSTSPSSRSSLVWHAGHLSGKTNSRSSPVRRSATGPTISGITSPALRSTTMSPISTPLRLISSALCKVAFVTVDPATWTASITPNGVTRPVLPVLAVVADVGAHAVQVGHDLDQVADRQAPPAQPVVPARLGIRGTGQGRLPGLGHAGRTGVGAGHHEPVHDQPERPARGDLRVFLPQ